MANTMRIYRLTSDVDDARARVGYDHVWARLDSASGPSVLFAEVMTGQTPSILIQATVSTDHVDWVQSRHECEDRDLDGFIRLFPSAKLIDVTISNRP